jgi:uncharacterized protein (TIGR02466 family)
MNNINLIFPTSVFIKDNILLNELESYKKNILNFFEKNKAKKSFSESNLTNNSYFTFNNIFNDIIFKNLIVEINNNCSNYCKELGFSDKQIINFGIQNIWANLIKKYDYHFFHSHATTGKALLSGVFYVDAPETAILKFQNLYQNYYTPEYPENLNVLSFSEFNYNCYPGRMIIFKSNTLHGYEPHLNDKEKISIAFNFGFKNSTDNKK